MSERVICRSGLTGWEDDLQNIYDSFEDWVSYSNMYGLVSKLGFSSTEKAWEANPRVQGSTDPTDYCRVVAGKRVFHDAYTGKRSRSHV